MNRLSVKVSGWSLKSEAVLLGKCAILLKMLCSLVTLVILSVRPAILLNSSERYVKPSDVAANSKCEHSVICPPESKPVDIPQNGQYNGLFENGRSTRWILLC